MVQLKWLQRRRVICAFLALFIFMLSGSIYAQGNSEIAVLPSTLERISWGAILAGTVLAVVIQLAGNLLAIGIGVNRANPNPGYGEDVPSAESIGNSTIVMMGGTILIALFVGGFVAARFAGNPDQGDALLHGLMVWGLDIVITLFLLTTTLGTIFSGLSAMLGQGLRFIGSATSAVTQGAASVVQGAVSAAGTVAGTVGKAAGDVAGAVGETAKDVAGTAQGVAQNVLENNPELQRLNNERNALMERIQNEAMSLVNQAGVDPNAVKDEAQAALHDAQTTVKDAVQQVQANPTDVQQIVTDTLSKLFQRGHQAVGQVEGQVEQVDYDSLIAILAERGNMTHQQAAKQVAAWENDYHQLRQQGEQTLRQVRQQTEQAIAQTKQEAERLQAEAKAKLEQARIDAEHKAREVAEATTKFISRLALAAFAAIMVGAFAAGIGGIAGAPGTIPTVEVESDTTSLDSVMLSSTTP